MIQGEKCITTNYGKVEREKPSGKRCPHIACMGREFGQQSTHLVQFFP